MFDITIIACPSSKVTKGCIVEDKKFQRNGIFEGQAARS